MSIIKRLIFELLKSRFVDKSGEVRHVGRIASGGDTLSVKKQFVVSGRGEFTRDAENLPHGRMHVEWSEYTGDDFEYYIIEEYINGEWKVIDIIDNKKQTTYTIDNAKHSERRYFRVGIKHGDIEYSKPISIQIEKVGDYRAVDGSSLSSDSKVVNVYDVTGNKLIDGGIRRILKKTGETLVDLNSGVVRSSAKIDSGALQPGGIVGCLNYNPGFLDTDGDWIPDGWILDAPAGNVFVYLVRDSIYEGASGLYSIVIDGSNVSESGNYGFQSSYYIPLGVFNTIEDDLGNRYVYARYLVRNENTTQDINVRVALLLYTINTSGEFVYYDTMYGSQNSLPPSSGWVEIEDYIHVPDPPSGYFVPRFESYWDASMSNVYDGYVAVSDICIKKALDSSGKEILWKDNSVQWSKVSKVGSKFSDLGDVDSYSTADNGKVFRVGASGEIDLTDVIKIVSGFMQSGDEVIDGDMESGKINISFSDGKFKLKFLDNQSPPHIWTVILSATDEGPIS